MSMRILQVMAQVAGASELIDIVGAHIDGCLYHGRSGLEFAERLVAGEGRVRVPSTLNVGAIDLIHPEHFQGSAGLAERARRLMQCYEELGCKPIFTCAPYQTSPRPALGEQVAWAESNAIVFANSVLGARTARYGDFIDICAAITGRVPAAGLHLTEERRGRVVFELDSISPRLLEDDAFYPVLGYWLGIAAERRVPVLDGLPPGVSEDQLKALGAAAASSGAVALFHAVGVTPEAPTLEAALQGEPAEETHSVTAADLAQARLRLSTAPDGKVDVIALGSPHFSVEEFAQLLPRLEAHPPSPSVEFIVCTHRLVRLALEQRGWLERLEALGVRVVVDTCVVVAPIVRTSNRNGNGVLMTNSGKFAHYTPGNIGFGVVWGSLEECVRSAAAGEVWRDPELWSEAS